MLFVIIYHLINILIKLYTNCYYLFFYFCMHAKLPDISILVFFYNDLLYTYN